MPCTRERLIELIEQYDSRIGSAIAKYNPKNKGSSVDAVNNAKRLLIDIENLCKEMDFWQKEYDDTDPLRIFQFQVALYICSKFNSTDTFGLKKAKIARDKLGKATRAYSNMNGASLNDKVEFIKGQIEATKTANELLCAQNPSGIDLPINLSILTFSLSPQFIPSVGTLEKMLQTAQDKVDSLIANITKGSEHHSSNATALLGLTKKTHDMQEPHIEVFTPNAESPVSLADNSPAQCHQNILEAITLGNIPRVKELFDMGFNLKMPISRRGENPLEYDMELGKIDVVVAIVERFKGDPNVEAAFQKACDNKNWKAAQAIDQERALAKQLDSKYSSKLHWYSFNNTAVKASMMREAERLADDSSINASSFYNWMSASQTSTYRQLMFWNSSPTNTTDFFRQKSAEAEIYNNQSANYQHSTRVL